MSEKTDFKLKTKEVALPPLPENLTPVLGESRGKPKYYRESILISDHAVLQYLGRKMGFDPEDVKARLLTTSIVEAIGKNSKTATSLGYKWRISNGRVVGIDRR